MELSGEIESVGKDVTRFKTGDQVFVSTVGMKFGDHSQFYKSKAILNIKQH
jgi:NADPH:quinone reductase-like Zn-dependent oxidoreductase